MYSLIFKLVLIELKLPSGWDKGIIAMGDGIPYNVTSLTLLWQCNRGRWTVESLSGVESPRLGEWRDQ